MRSLEKVLQLCEYLARTRGGEYLECLYLLSQYRDDLEHLLQALKLRYGSEYRYYLTSTLLLHYLSEEERSRISKYLLEKWGPDLRKLVEERIEQCPEEVRCVLRIYARYCGEEVDAEVLNLLLHLSTGQGLDLLLRLGLVNPVSRSTVLPPPYVTPVLERLRSEEVKLPEVPVYEVFLQLAETSPHVLALVETLLRGEEPEEELYAVLYGRNLEEDLRNLYVPRICATTRTGFLVVNPLLEPDTVLSELMEVKSKLAREKLGHLLIASGEVEFSEQVRALVAYLLLPRTSTPLALILTPWLAPSRRVLYWNWRAPRLFALPGRPPKNFLEYLEVAPRKLDKTGWLFVAEYSTIYYVPPRYETPEVRKYVEELREEGFEVINVYETGPTTQ